MRVLVSAGEASGDLYAALLVEELRRRWPRAEFFGCAGPRMRAAGVEAAVHAESLAVVGLAEVISHIPRIWGEYRKLLNAARSRRPDLVILTDAPDFHLRLAPRLKRLGARIAYLVAPQVWAWRRGRLRVLRRTVDRLLCIFPFEEQFFCDQGVRATYLGHPLARRARPWLERAVFFQKHRLPEGRPLITLLPGSRRGEAARHLPALIEAAERIYGERAASLLLPASPNTGAAFFRERIGRAPIQVIEGENWDAIGHAELALAASGTVTIEAALLGTPMVAFYKVAGVSWLLGKALVRVPFYTMVNLVAGRQIVPELMQNQLTGERLAQEALKLLRDQPARDEMRAGLREVARKLETGGDAIQNAAAVIEELVEEKHVS